MRGLFGDFNTMPLKDVVVYLGNKRATGSLSVERQGLRKKLLLKDGMIVSASSNEPREYLGQFLINMGYISEDQFSRAYQTQQETKVYLGKILAMIGLVSEEVVTTALSMKFRETLLDAFCWEDGTFEFYATEASTPAEGLDLQLDLLDIHREGEFRETAWQAIRSVFPSGNLKLEVDESKLPEPPKPGTIDERLIRLIKAGHTIEEMVLALHATDFFLYQRLYALYRQEAVKVAEAVEIEVEAEITLADEASAEELMHHAEQALTANDFVRAESLAKRAYEQAPGPVSGELLRKAEGGLLTLLRAELLEPDRVPRLMINPSQLKTLQLTAPERYLLSRVDGVRNMSSIVHVSPLRELDALKFFRRFGSQGLVAWG